MVLYGAGTAPKAILLNICNTAEQKFFKNFCSAGVMVAFLLEIEAEELGFG
jgi:hypothetical protein